MISVDRPLSWELATYTLADVRARAANAGSSAWFMQRHPGTSTDEHGAYVVDHDLSGLFDDYSREACARILARHGVELGVHEGG